MILICMLERVVPWLIVAEAGEILSAKSGDGGGGGDWTGTDVPPPQPAMLGDCEQRAASKHCAQKSFSRGE
jgi:hypothetical protein